MGGDDTTPLLATNDNDDVHEVFYEGVRVGHDPSSADSNISLPSANPARVRNGRTWTCSLVLSISVAIIGCSFQFGFQTGAMGMTQNFLKNATRFNATDEVAALWVSGLPIGGLVGGLSAGIISDTVGRKKCMLLNNLPLLIGTALMAVGLNSWVFLVGRIIAGFACGVATGVAPMYISEISPVSVKGAVGVSHQFMITFGILVAFGLGYGNLLNSFSSYWHMYFAFPLLPAAYQLVLLMFCPESPNWLYYNREREDLARAALTKLRGSAEKADEEIDEMIKERTAKGDSVMVSWGELFSSPNLRLALIIGLGLQCAQQLSGVNAILNYAPEIFKGAGFDNADLATVITGGINVVMTFISVPLMDKLGRRTLMLLGLGGMIASYVGVAVAQHIHAASPDQEWTSPLSVVTTLTFIVCFAIGPGSIPWLIVAEIFTSDSRGKASSLCVGANWICNLLVCITYKYLDNALKPNTFFLYTGICVFFLIFTFLFVPETRKKPVEQICREIKEQSLKCPPTVF